MGKIPDGAVHSMFEFGVHGTTMVAKTTFGNGKISFVADPTRDGKRFILGMYKKMAEIPVPYEELDRLADSDLSIPECIRAIDDEAYDWTKGPR